MRQTLQGILWTVGLGLQFLVLSALLSGPFKEFLVIFIYTICLFVTSTLEILVALDSGQLSRTWQQYYWIGELIRQTGMYCVVVSLAIRALPPDSRRPVLQRTVIAVASVFWIGSMLIYYGPLIATWMTRAIRNLSLSTAIANLILWFVLIATERRDTRLFLITGGLGLQMTGEAVGQSMRQFRGNIMFAGSMITVLAHFLCLYIWWQAFRNEPPPPKGSSSTTGSSPS